MENNGGEESVEEMLSVLAKEAERAAKKQRASTDAQLSAIDAALSVVDSALNTTTCKTSINDVRSACDSSISSARSQVDAADRELNSALATRLARAVDRAFPSDACRVPVDPPEMQCVPLLRLGAQHMHRTGCFEEGQSLVDSCLKSCNSHQTGTPEELQLLTGEPWHTLRRLSQQISNGDVAEALHLNDSGFNMLKSSSSALHTHPLNGSLPEAPDPKDGKSEERNADDHFSTSAGRAPTDTGTAQPRRHLDDDEDERLKAEFELKRLEFLKALNTYDAESGATDMHSGSRAAAMNALAYARREVSQFVEQFPEAVRELMGALLFCGRIERSPYAHLAGPSVFHAAANTFVKRQLRRLGHASTSPLLTVVNAGALALPRLSKLASIGDTTSVPVGRGCVRTTSDAYNDQPEHTSQNLEQQQPPEQLPIELELGNEFCFHSVFACPVARDQAGSDNPPMLLPCGLVLGRQSISRLCTGNRFKCPYCPQEMTVSQCQRIFF